MNIPKKVIGIVFLLTGFMGGLLLGYFQMWRNPLVNFLSKDAIMIIYSIVYVGFLASWFMLFDHLKKVEGVEKK